MTDQKPTITQGKIGNCDPYDHYDHPAYGTITMSAPRSSRNVTLFGSDLGHRDFISIEISHASMKRDLNRDWIHSEKSIVKVELSHAQFAQFITSQGNGSGTPVTLNWVAGEGQIPGIINPETKHEINRREIGDAARERLDAIRKKIADLGAMIESGKLPKKELRDLHKDLAREASYLPGTLEFVVKSAEEALEKATSDAKIEVESYIAMTAQRMGLKSIRELGQLENKAAMDELTAEAQANGDYD